jgi:hypothetical protein
MLPSKRGFDRAFDTAVDSKGGFERCCPAGHVVCCVSVLEDRLLPLFDPPVTKEQDDKRAQYDCRAQSSRITDATQPAILRQTPLSTSTRPPRPVQ